MVASVVFGSIVLAIVASVAVTWRTMRREAA
jgi:hypothetical protein